MSAFSELAGKVAAQYRKAGMSAERAKAIGGGVAYKQGVKKFGKKGMARKAAAGRRAMA